MAVATKTKPVSRPFATAKEVGKNDKGTTWIVDGTGAVPTLIDLCHKAAEAVQKFEVAKGKLLAIADERLTEAWATTGSLPPLPIYLDDGTGKQVTLVVADKTKSSKTDDATLQLLAAAVGHDLPPDFTTTVDAYRFDAELLETRVRCPQTGKKAELRTLISNRIAPLLDALVADEELTRDQADGLLIKETKTTYATGALGRIGEFTKGNVDRLRAAVAVLGSAFGRSFKVADAK